MTRFAYCMSVNIVYIVVQILFKYVKTINEICYYILFHRFCRNQKYQKKFIFLY